jgi:hypothetical protein
LLLLTTVIAVGAAFFAWRERQLQPQRRAVARIVELGGSVEVERRGWIEAIRRGCETEEVVSVTLPGDMAEKAVPTLKALSSLREVTLAYRREPPDGEWACVIWWCSTTGQVVNPTEERARRRRIQRELDGVEVKAFVDGQATTASQ